MSNNEADWKLLLKAVKAKGKDEVYRQLSIIHNTLLNMQANLYAEPETVSKASKMNPVLARQAETLYRLKNLDEKELESVK